MINQSSAIQSMNGKIAAPKLQHVQSSIENQEQNHKQQKLSKELDSWKSLDISKVVEEVDLADTGDLSVVPPEITEPCPNNFIRFKDSCYHIAQPNRYDFGVGESYCNAYDAKLVEINSRSEQKFVEELIELTKNNLIQVAKGELAFLYIDKICEVNILHICIWKLSTVSSRQIELKT